MLIEPTLDLFEPRERVTIFAPLCIRFWDSARDVPVSDGLTVTARPLKGRHVPIQAFRTASGLYAFQGLPGLRDVEYPSGDSAFVASPPSTTRFIIEVSDRQRRFLAVVFSVDVPYRGIFPTGMVSSPLGSQPPGFYLFSAPTRPITPSLAVVRVQLEERVDAVTRRPAAHAVVEIQPVGQKTAYGLADERGCAAVLFPYPTFTGKAGNSSPLAAMVQSWKVNIRVRHEPAALVVPSGSKIPDLRSIFNQASADIWATLAGLPGQPVSQLSADLIYGQELVVRTDDGSTLLISPAVLPP